MPEISETEVLEKAVEFFNAAQTTNNWRCNYNNDPQIPGFYIYVGPCHGNNPYDWMNYAWAELSKKLDQEKEGIFLLFSFSEDNGCFSYFHGAFSSEQAVQEFMEECKEKEWMTFEQEGRDYRIIRTFIDKNPYNQHVQLGWT